jgi:hypothetical protein
LHASCASRSSALIHLRPGFVRTHLRAEWHPQALGRGLLEELPRCTVLGQVRNGVLRLHANGPERSCPESEREDLCRGRGERVRTHLVIMLLDRSFHVLIQEPHTGSASLPEALPGTMGSHHQAPRQGGVGYKHVCCGDAVHVNNSDTQTGCAPEPPSSPFEALIRSHGRQRAALLHSTCSYNILSENQHTLVRCRPCPSPFAVSGSKQTSFRNLPFHVALRLLGGISVLRAHSRDSMSPHHFPQDT